MVWAGISYVRLTLFPDCFVAGILRDTPAIYYLHFHYSTLGVLQDTEWKGKKKKKAETSWLLVSSMYKAPKHWISLVNPPLTGNLQKKNL